MMQSLRLFIALCWCLFANLQTLQAGRFASMQVVERLKDIEPKHSEVKRRIINYVYAAKTLLVSRTDEFYRELLTAKEASLASSIALEDELLFQVDHHHRPSADHSCLVMLRTIVDSNMNVAGVGYTNCISTVEAGLDRELRRALKLLQVDESDVFFLKLLDVFEGENIIFDPDRILAKLSSKSDRIDVLGSACLTGLFDIVAKFSAALWDLRNAYRACLNTNEAILRLSYEASKSQLTDICLGAAQTHATSA